MTFKEALDYLGIEDYSDRIFNSNSHGELFHLHDYILIAQMQGNMSWFRSWFEDTVKWAEENWSRPASIFQHIPRCLDATIKMDNIIIEALGSKESSKWKKLR